MPSKPHIVLVIPRGEAARNFLYSDTLPVLSKNARVTLLSVIDDDDFCERFNPHVEQIVSLAKYSESGVVRYLRHLTHEAHFRWLWSEVAKNRWEMWDYRVKHGIPEWDRGDETAQSKASLQFQKALYTALGNRPALAILSSLERTATLSLRPTRFFDTLFEKIKPDLVFNGSHIHGTAGELPLKVAHQKGIPTAGFIFSWDNLTSRSRIFVPYDYYLVWHEQMQKQLLDIYPDIPAKNVFITGTPQLDFHFKPEYCLSREALAEKIGFDPQRPFILYTTGINKHFPEEHRTVELVIKLLDEIDIHPKPQLVVRVYAKGRSDDMMELAAKGYPDVYFPKMQWDKRWLLPAEEDLNIYTSLVQHTCLGINAASTVSLELMMHDKPVINLGFDPPGSDLPYAYRFERHIYFDHYLPVAQSGGVMVARSTEDMREMLIRGLRQPQADSPARKAFIKHVFAETLDGHSGQRVAERLVDLASRKAQ